MCFHVSFNLGDYGFQHKKFWGFHFYNEALMQRIYAVFNDLQLLYVFLLPETKILLKKTKREIFT